MNGYTWDADNMSIKQNHVIFQQLWVIPLGCEAGDINGRAAKGCCHCVMYVKYESSI